MSVGQDRTRQETGTLPTRDAFMELRLAAEFKHLGLQVIGSHYCHT